MTVHFHCNRTRRKEDLWHTWILVGLWQWFALGKADRVLFVTSNRCIPVEGTGGWSAVVFCACEIIELFSVVFCVVRTVQKFYSMSVLNGTRNKWRPVFITETFVMQGHRIVFVTGSVFSPDRLGDCYGTLPTICRSTECWSKSVCRSVPMLQVIRMVTDVFAMWRWLLKAICWWVKLGHDMTWHDAEG